MFGLATAQPSTPATGFSQPAQATGLASKPVSLGGVATTAQPVQQTASTGFSLTQQPAKTDGFQLGGLSSGFKLGGLTSSVATTTPAASGFQLGSTAGTGSGVSAAAPFLSSALASSTNAQQKPAAATTAAATKSGFMLGGSASSTTPSSGFQLGGGLKLGTTTATKTTAPPVASASPFSLAATSTAPKTAIAPSAGSFGLTSSAATTTAAPASSSTSSGFKLGGGLSLGGAAATTSSSLGGGIKLPGATAATTTTTATAAVVAETPSLRYKDLETRINKWTNELEQQEQLFLTQATQVNAWDKLLIDNGEKITNLNSEFEKVKCDQDRLDQEIDFIRTQQQELEDLLLPLEEKTRQQVSSLAGAVHTHHADVERERTYNLAENIDAQLKQMVQDLKEVIEHINATSQPADAADPVNQISKILSAHMDSLQWLDSNSGALQQKLNVLVKEVNAHKVEQESRFRLAFD
uniref:nuclear pore glycoprotein p62-like n=1 Tax=Ciona intestinalis TaxID=7719 RepID=UPI000180C53F|nr:nuclear pore glycoprotein p62-like [Ciona intestinalis]|eukprot:XP_002129766.1 nuclear pore glycoprotein p62-like [Ciona intestinalis]